MTKRTGLRIGLIGLGRWGTNWARVLSELGVLEWVWDINPEAIPVELHDKYVEEWSNAQTDGVVIVTPPESHFEQAYSYMSAGIPVLVEKPLTTSSEGAWELYQLSQRKNVPFMVGHTFFYDPYVREGCWRIKDLGTFNRRLSLRWSQDGVRSGRDTDVLTNLGPHPLSLLWLLGFRDIRPDTTAFSKDNLRINVYDQRNNYIGLVHLTQEAGASRERSIQLTSADGSEIVHVDAGKQVRVHGDMVQPSWGWTNEPLRVEAKDFLNLIDRPVTPETGMDGVWVSRMMDSIRRQIRV